MRSALAVAALLLAVSCAGAPAPANRAAGTIGGRTWSGQVTRAEYCEHCAGGEMVFVDLADARGVALSLHFEQCRRGRVPIDPDSYRGARLIHAMGGRGISGQLRIDECSRERLRATFSAQLEGGGSVRGRIDSRLTFSAGYD